MFADSIRTPLYLKARLSFKEIGSRRCFYETPFLCKSSGYMLITINQHFLHPKAQAFCWPSSHQQRSKTTQPTLFNTLIKMTSAFLIFALEINSFITTVVKAPRVFFNHYLSGFYYWLRQEIPETYCISTKQVKEFVILIQAILFLLERHAGRKEKVNTHKGKS